MKCFTYSWCVQGLVKVSGTSVSPLPDFTALSSQIAMITPSLTNSANYIPTNSPTTCPSVGASWVPVATPLPPTPNQQLCTCMTGSRTCVVTPNADITAFGNVFNYICTNDPAACNGIAANASAGTYGAFSGCNPAEQLSYVMDQYYQAQPQANKASACSFSGLATLQSASSATGSCSSLLAQAGTNGGGTVATPTGNSAYQGGTSTATSTSTSTATKSAAGALSIPAFDTGILQLGLYVFCASLAGAGIILL